MQWAVPVSPTGLLTDGAVLASELKFDAATPPMCFIHGDADQDSVMNSVTCWERLRKMGVQSDLHTLAHTSLDRVWEFMNCIGVNK